MAAYNFSTDVNSQVAADANSLNNLKYATRDNSPESIKAAAVQFEALMVNMMLKSMRDATPKEGMFDSEQSRTFISMLDQQLSQQIANRGTGLADMLARQLQGSLTSVPPEALDSLAATPRTMPSNINPAFSSASSTSVPQNAREFVQQMSRHAEAASQDSGIPAHLMLGQAALETGWGKRQITGTDGTASNNLFGIKAGPNWKGKTVEALTTEYINGVPQKRIEKFRAYDSYADSFRDFASLMQNNPRYENVLGSTGSAAGYAQAMQDAGYATDPNYASKLRRVIESIGTA
ncbi:flagellar assembly peptidoglycan hydrolase FlgJ [Methylobacillus arboreus]|uniref:flagellar assembly peptidoglycan hydrolase FlgJ n=1 Tax=Methylobacillus arboreus TaxID=755170 RepID=UPI001E3B7BDA|nr:flagellar assembly peptidoglycan hydrolase FlgJ [Methylobacillus arboreus]MCB5189278.1 flagellar assembly peptidoglycan hydrolase FlgJ [Methylobacillus arboreus]